MQAVAVVTVFAQYFCPRWFMQITPSRNCEPIGIATRSHLAKAFESETL